MVRGLRFRGFWCRGWAPGSEVEGVCVVLGVR